MSEFEDELKTPEGRQIVEAGRVLYRGGREDGAREEREAVTGWLNSWASHLAAHPHRTDVELIWWIAKQIEAGEHRKEAPSV